MNRGDNLPSSGEQSPIESSTPPSNSKHSDTDSDDIKQLSQDLTQLDEQEAQSSRLLIYTRNKYIFLLQSMLLGISYSIIWPTLLPYVRRETHDLKSSLFMKFVYGMTFVSYPIGSMLSAKLVEKTNLPTKRMVLFLNCFEIIGNLTYSLPFLPLLPAFGRFFAGLGDAFYVVLMKEMRGNAGVNNEKMTIECLAAFVLGVVLSPGVNILTTLMHFNWNDWILDATNYPGLAAAVLFLIQQVIIMIFLKDVDGDQPRIQEKSNSNEPRKGSTFITSRFVEFGNFVREMEYTTWFVNTYAFLYTYTVAMFELIIPFLMYDRLKCEPVSVMLLYAIIGTVYGMFLMVTMTITFEYQPEVFVGLSATMQIAGMFSITYFTWLNEYTVEADVIGIGVMVVGLAILWSVDDVLFINFVQLFVPYYQRETSHEMRKFTSKIAFVAAGITIPIMFPMPLLFVAPVLIALTCALVVLFIVIKLSVSKEFLA